MRSILLGFLVCSTAALSQVCTTTVTTNCPSTGSPSIGDQFGGTTNWSGIANVYSAPTVNGGSGQNFNAFPAGEGTSLSTLASQFSPHPNNPIVYDGQFWPFWQNFFDADPATCPTTGTCYYNNVANAEAAADAMFKPISAGGMGLTATSINIDPAPWYMATSGNGFSSGQQYATYCAAYSSAQVPASTSCYSVPTSPTNYQQILTRALATYTTVFAYIRTHYPTVTIHFAPVPSPNVWTVCGLSTIGSRTEAAVESCMAPLYQTMVANVTTARFTLMHEPTGSWKLFCDVGSGSPPCPLLSSPATLDTFLQNMAAAVKATSPTTKVGAGGTFTDMGLVGGVYTCPSSGNFWCNWTTLDTFLDYLGMDIYPSASQTSAQYASLIGTPSPAQATYTYMAQRVTAASWHPMLYCNESSAMRWSYTGGGAGSGEPATYAGAGWYGSAVVTGAWNQWLQAVAVDWAQSMGFSGWSYIDGVTLTYLSTDANNTHACPGCFQTNNGTPPADTYMITAMAALPEVSPIGLIYGALSAASMQAPILVTGNAKLRGNTHTSGPPGCLINSTNCTPIVINGDPYSTSGQFSGYADLTIRCDPQTLVGTVCGKLWMAYSYLKVVGSGTQVVETHLAYSTNSGVTWTYMGTLFPSVAETSPPGMICGIARSATQYTSNEVANLYPVVSGGVTWWIMTNQNYWLPDGSGGANTEPCTIRWRVVAAPDTTGTQGPMVVASATPQWLGTTITNTDSNFPVTVNLDTLSSSGPPLSGCATFIEPSLITASSSPTATLFLQMSCGTLGFVAQFSTPRPLSNVGTWTWSYVAPSGGLFATGTDAAGICGYAGLCALSPRITQMDLAPSAVSPGTIEAIFSLVYVNGSGGKIGGGCVTAPLATLSPPTFVYNAGHVAVSSVILSADSVSEGPGSCSYSPYSVNGVIIDHKMSNCVGGSSAWCSSQGGRFHLLEGSGFMP